MIETTFNLLFVIQIKIQTSHRSCEMRHFSLQQLNPVTHHLHSTVGWNDEKEIEGKQSRDTSPLSLFQVKDTRLLIRSQDCAVH